MKMNFTAEKINEYESLIKSRLSEYRYNHSMNVAESAVYLAEKYGADCEKAYVAGVLHDIMKEESLEIQCQFIESDGYKMTGTELAVPSVYHQMSGAAYCKKVLGIDDDEIIGAIRFHTTGKADMTLLEKVVYTADFISAERNYPDVDIMRRLADENLEKAMLHSLKYTIGSLSEREIPIHPDTLNCYNFILENYFVKE